MTAVPPLNCPACGVVVLWRMLTGGSIDRGSMTDPTGGPHQCTVETVLDRGARGLDSGITSATTHPVTLSSLSSSEVPAPEPPHAGAGASPTISAGAALLAHQYIETKCRACDGMGFGQRDGVDGIECSRCGGTGTVKRKRRSDAGRKRKWPIPLDAAHGGTCSCGHPEGLHWDHEQCRVTIVGNPSRICDCKAYAGVRLLDERGDQITGQDDQAALEPTHRPAETPPMSLPAATANPAGSPTTNTGQAGSSPADERAGPPPRARPTTTSPEAKTASRAETAVRERLKAALTRHDAALSALRDTTNTGQEAGAPATEESTGSEAPGLKPGASQAENDSRPTITGPEEATAEAKNPQTASDDSQGSRDGIQKRGLLDIQHTETAAGDARRTEPDNHRSSGAVADASDRHAGGQRSPAVSTLNEISPENLHDPDADRERIARDLGRVVVRWDDNNRLQGIGASEAWLVVHDPMALYCLKRGIVAPHEDTEAMEAGRFMEPGARAWFAHRTGYRVRGDGRLVVRHPTEPWLFASPDGIVYDRNDALLGGLELKCVGEWAKLEWGPEDDPDAPEKFYFQCQVQQGVTGLKKTWLAAVFGGNKPRFDFTIDFDPEFFAAWLVIARKLWHDIVAGRAPDVTASDSSAAYLRAKYPRPEREELPPAPAEALGWAERYLAAGEAITPLEREQKEAKHLLQDAIGKAGAPGLMLNEAWPVTWKPRKDGARVFSLRRPTP